MLKQILRKIDPLIEKGPETKVKVIEKPVGNPRKGPAKSPEVTGKRLEAANQKAPRKAIERGGSGTACPSGQIPIKISIY